MNVYVHLCSLFSLPLSLFLSLTHKPTQTHIMTILNFCSMVLFGTLSEILEVWLTVYSFCGLSWWLVPLCIFNVRWQTQGGALWGPSWSPREDLCLFLPGILGTLAMGTILCEFLSLQLLGRCKKCKCECQTRERGGLWLHIVRGPKSPGQDREASSTHPLRMKSFSSPSFKILQFKNIMLVYTSLLFCLFL